MNTEREGSHREERFESVAQRLRALPRELPPPLSWEALRERMARGKSARPMPLGWVPAAMAAALLLAALLVAREYQAPPRSIENPLVARSPLVARTDGEMPPRGAEAPIHIAELPTAERWLAEHPDEGARVRVGRAWAIAALEDRIASQDDALNAARLGRASGEQLREMQQERVRLIHSLVLVRYAEDLAGQ